MQGLVKVPDADFLITGEDDVGIATVAQSLLALAKSIHVLIVDFALPGGRTPEPANVFLAQFDDLDLGRRCIIEPRGKP